MKDRLKFHVGVVILFGVAYLLKIPFIVPLVLSLLYAYLRASQKFTVRSRYKLLYPVFLFVIMFGITYFLFYQRLSGLFIPLAMMPLVLTVLFNDLVLTLLFTVGLSTTIVALSGNNFALGVLAMVGGLSAGIFVFQARRRSAIIRAGFFAGLMQCVCLYFLQGMKLSNWQYIAWAFANGVGSGIAALPMLLFFEYLFKVVTNMSLLELSDTRDNPLLRQMILKAPGTYHHSLIVGNLAEAAAEAINANALLARVGSYYHDIGKIDKSEYFIENQMSQQSSHEELKPSMSKLVVMNHVKEGIDLARKYRLNPAIIDFIAQHHGTSLVYYFYRKALQNMEADQEITEEGFRYLGPKPKTKEAAIVLLADSVEAASRTLKDSSHAKIEEMVHKIINNKFIDGQLDECELTLRDLEMISTVFIKILGSIYHARVTYPETASEDQDTQSAESTTHTSAKDKKSHS